ncbi:MAG: hypothetical protein ABSA47_11740 [Verrucomicrobiota bacterium]|jgi:hypothetical protein
MNLSDLQTKLIGAARMQPPLDHVPYAFEKRIMARIAAASPLNAWALWGRPLWRAALSCVAITLLCGLWSFASAHRSGADSSNSFAQEVEHTVFASLNQHVEDAW